MRKIIVVGILIVSNLALCKGMTSFAEEIEDVSKKEELATSYGSIELTADSESKTEPLIPTDPDGKTGNIGELTIDNVSPFIFGSQKLTGKKATFYSTTTDANVQVTDKRGTGTGWLLQVRSSEFVDSENKLNILKGAELTIPVGTVSSDEGNSSETPIASQVTLSDEDATIFKAESKAGLGSWVNKFDGTENTSKVKIDIPAGSMKGSYVSTITWTLSDAPK